MDKYQKRLDEFLTEYARSQNLPKQLALRDILGDLQTVAKENGLLFDMALLAINNTEVEDLVDEDLLKHRKQEV